MSKSGYLQDLIGAADDSVKGTLMNGRGLRDFLATIDKLEPADFALIVDQAIKLLEGFYVHLPLKRAMHAVDPLQRLRLLRRRAAQLPSEIAFHHEMTEIFTSLRDLHTNYILPAHFGRMVAFLPFRISACFEAGIRKYILAQRAKGFDHPTFVPGVTLAYWNGIPIDRAIEIAASYHAGSNPAARHARGVAGLTRRAMIVSPPPDEEWVTVGYQDQSGNPQEYRVDWTITDLPFEESGTAVDGSVAAQAAFGLDLEGDTFRQIDKMLFNQQLIKERRRMDDVRSKARASEQLKRATTGAMESTKAAQTETAVEATAASDAAQGTESTMPDIFIAKVVTVAGRRFAYIRILTFSVPNDKAFVNEFLRLIELPEMPKDGLIIDVRGNGGGLIWAGERLLQLLTPNIIEPCRVQFINTAANLELCRNLQMLGAWAPSLARALETGAAFSAGFPITPPEECNDIGQRYYGPVVLITNARCYSTTDIFAAGFQDHKIGKILGTDNNTGAGGANVWTLDFIRQRFVDANLPPPLDALPKGTGMRVAIRRTLRVGDEAGTELEDLGVKPDIDHRLTRNDILHEDVDLIAEAARILADPQLSRPPITFNVTASRTGDTLKFKIATKGVDYIDPIVADRQLATRTITGDALDFQITKKTAGFALPANAKVELRGYFKNKLVCRQRLSV